MPMRKGLLGVEIANKIIRWVYLERKGRDHSLLRTGTSKLNAEVPAPGCLFKSIEDILKQESLYPARIFLTLAHTDTVIHQIILPKISARDLSGVVSSEIERLPFFTHRDFDYICRKTFSAQEKDTILFAAVPRDILDFLCAEIEQTDIFCRDLEIAPLNLSRLVPQTQTSKDLFVFLIVYEQFSHLVIVQGGEIQYLYKSSAGLDRFPVKGKLNNEGLLVNWAGELNRVLKSFLLKNNIDSLSRIWIVWDQVKAPELAGFLSGQLETLVEPFPAADSLNIRIEQGSFNSIYVLALTPIIHYIHRLKPRFSLDYFLRRFQLKKHLYYSAAACLIFIVITAAALGLFGSIFDRQAAKLHHQRMKLTRQRATLEKESQSLFAEQQEYLETRQRLLAQATLVNSLNRVSWSQVFSVVARELPDHLALTSFQFSDTRKAQIRGQALDMEAIAELIRRIEESKILQDGKFDFLSEREIKNQKIYNFGILARLKETKND